MSRKWIEDGFILAVLLISLISISAAAGPTARPDLYQGQCGVELSVSAPGILANDIPISGKPLHVSSWTAPTIGTLTVDPSGSFVYEPPQNMPSGTYVYFYYTATDGTSVTNQALVKIAVSCKCGGSAPDVNVCIGTAITPSFLITQGAGCMGCRDVTPMFDLSKIPDQPVAGKCYPYTVSCPNGILVTGHVCFGSSCTITSVPFTVCSSVVPTTTQIMDRGSVTCSCDMAPAISNIHLVGDHWEYTITCHSECGSATRTGIVNIDTPCRISFLAFSIPTDSCPDHVLPTSEQIISLGAVRCGDCDATPVISNIHWVEPIPEAANEWVGEYTITCTSRNGCQASETGQFSSAACEVNKCINVVCDDENPCTDDSCDPATGCVHTANSASCDDGNACTENDVCADKACTSGAAVSCEDNNVCTDDSCNPATGCVNTANSASCDDGNACTEGDVCVDKKCTSGEAVSCEDNNVCTDDSCNPATGCVYTANSASCDDGNACTENDVCADKKCTSGEAVSCEDNNVCTDDSCNPATGCVYTANSASCDDGNACTVDDVCAHGLCAAGTAISCDDGNLCTEDSCNPATGCVNVENTATCDDNNACTDDSCDPASGCVHTTVSCGVNAVCTDDNGAEACSCQGNYQNCDSVTGCESNPLTDISNCGDCGNTCPTYANSRATCSGGVCGIICNNNYADCNNYAPDGCEYFQHASNQACTRNCECFNGICKANHRCN